MTLSNCRIFLGQNPDKLLFFRDAVLDVYRAPNGLYGFTYYRNRGYWHVFNREPIYLNSEAALQSAKRYCIETAVKLDTDNIKIAVDFCSDLILYQNRLAQKCLGNVEGYKALELFRDRDHIRRKLQEEESVNTRCSLQTLDGKPMEGMLVAELIELAPNTVLSIETFKPDEVLRSR